MLDENTKNKIQSLIDDNPVVLFMKGSADMPMCGFSGVVAHVLKLHHVSYLDVNVLDDMDVREGIKAFSNWPTIPQLYVKGEFIGGCDIIKEMHEAGELAELFSSES